MQLKQNEYLQLLEFMQTNYGINLEKKRQLIEGRLHGVVVQKGYQSYGEYFDAILNGKNKEDISILLNRLTTNHTFFMREANHFDFLEKTVLPNLKQTVTSKDLRMWCAGCSSGEEAYTLSMILQDVLGQENTKWDKTLLATDISRNVLTQAVNGVYTEEAVNELKASWRCNYFHKIGKDSYQVKPEIRKEIVFRIFNLMDSFPFKKKFHVIFCRNVMIYFDQSTKEKLVQKFYDMTEDGGYLFIGMSESLGRGKMPYQYVMPSVYRKG